MRERGAMMGEFFWLGPDGKLKTIEEAVAEWIKKNEARVALAREIVDLRFA
jgi:hypothetical protein